jgi:hypothetical protein
MKTYRVSGPFAFRGNQPGSTFEADPDDRQIHRAIARGGISAATGSDDDGLGTLSRDELDALAAEKGIEDPKSLPNKDAVKAAIAEATTDEPDNAGDAGGKE